MDLTIGIVLVIVGGALEGLFSLAVTRTRKWQWENIWGLGSLIALVLVPWPVALLTVPDLFAVFASVSPWLLVCTFLFGLGWVWEGYSGARRSPQWAWPWGCR